MWHYEGEEKCIRGCSRRNLKEREYLENVRVDMRIILKWTLKIELTGVNWINLAQNKDKWQAFVKTVINLRIP